MTVYAAIGLAVCVMSAAGLVAALVTATLRLRRVIRRARRIAAHPVAASWSVRCQSQSGGAIPDLGRLRSAFARLRRANDNIARAAARSVRLALDIDRVAFAVRLLLETFVPSLKGSVR